MEPEPEIPPIQRHKCSACYKQYKEKEHLVDHMKVSYHSIHDPKCAVCKKHCKTLESVREHLTGPLPKGNCAEMFATNGCDTCLNIFDGVDALDVHKSSCRLAPAVTPELESIPIVDQCAQADMEFVNITLESETHQGTKVIAMDCEMVGGGSDGSLNLCARVCLVDENENVIFHSYVKPQISVTDYRHEITGITEENLVNANPFMQVKHKVEEILNNGDPAWRTRLEGTKAKILVGHDLEHDLYCLQLDYPDHLIRDTAKYRPLMRTNLISHSLKYLTKTYLGYEIQTGYHDPYEDCVAALRLYKRMCSQVHQIDSSLVSNGSNDIIRSKKNNPFDYLRQNELVKLSPDALLAMSGPNYRCWCLDGRAPPDLEDDMLD